VKGFTVAKDMVRAFVAVAISDDVRRRLAEEQARLRRTGARVSWVAPENIHLTLAFLGDVFPERIAGIGAALTRIGAATVPFEFAVAGLGYFGSQRSPRVIWAGITEGAEALGVLQQRVDRALRELDFTLEDRPFKPHLTFGRVRAPGGADELAARIDAARDVACGTVAVDRVLLMRSELRPAGPIYTVLHDAPLSGPPNVPVANR
jgi:RNA 2',3'-cyclic 3'-phosphodiesterase